MFKTRFAPSPTGYLTLGNVRTALFCVLLAKARQGIFLLRIEDTDQTRSTLQFTEQLEQDLHWLELFWQEGPGIEGQYGPYFQSQRQAVYAHYYDQLTQAGSIYPCFCTDQELLIARKVQLASGRPPRYAGTCYNLTAQQIANKHAQGLKPTLRFHVPSDQVIEFVDFVKGPQRFLASDIGDFIIRRADGSAAFFFCNAVDDALMGITHVLRGDDHLTNTPRQLMLLQALGLPAPHYGHLPLILGSDGSPLSKRHGSQSIKELREQGFLHIALQNYLARLGHHYTDNKLMNLTELSEKFSVTALSKSPAHYDPDQLLFWQKQAVLQLDVAHFWQWLGAAAHQVPKEKQADFVSLIQGNILFPNDALRWAKILFTDEMQYSAEGLTIVKQTDRHFFAKVLQVGKKHGWNYSDLIKTLQTDLSVRGKALFQPLRVAFTGRVDGPELVRIMQLLGPARLEKRLELVARPF